MSDEIMFEELMPKEEGSVKSLREFLRAERAREGRTGNEEWIKSMVKRGGYGGQFNGGS